MGHLLPIGKRRADPRNKQAALTLWLMSMLAQVPRMNNGPTRRAASRSAASS